MLTREDAQKLARRFSADEHEAREGGKTRGGDNSLWLFYIEEGAVIERLNEVDPAWSLEITRTTHHDGYVSTYGTLTVKGVSRSGVGTNSPSRTGDAIGENEEKGAATDLLKRLARLFGVGLYLKKSPRVYLDATLKPWEAQKQALSKLEQWLEGASPSGPPARRRQPEPVDWGKYSVYVSEFGLTINDVQQHAGEDLAVVAKRDGKVRLMALAEETAEAKQTRAEADAAHDVVPPESETDMLGEVPPPELDPERFTG